LFNHISIYDWSTPDQSRYLHLWPELRLWLHSFLCLKKRPHFLKQMKSNWNEKNHEKNHKYKHPHIAITKALPGNSSSSSVSDPSFGRRSGAPYHFLNLGPPEIKQGGTVISQLWIWPPRNASCSDIHYAVPSM